MGFIPKLSAQNTSTCEETLSEEVPSEENALGAVPGASDVPAVAPDETAAPCSTSCGAVTQSASASEYVSPSVLTDSSLQRLEEGHGAIDDPHFQPSGVWFDACDTTDVLLKLEVITARETKAVLLWMRLVIYLSFGLLLALLIIKVTADEYAIFFDTKAVPVANVVFGGVLLIVTFTCLLFNAIAIAKTRRHTWNPRAWYQVVTTLAQLCCSLLCLVFLIVPNAYVIYCQWGWFANIVQWSGVVRWTCWNTLYWIYAFQASQLLVMADVRDKLPGSTRGLTSWQKLRRVKVKGFSLDIWACWALLVLIWLIMEIVLITFGSLLTSDYTDGNTTGDLCHDIPSRDDSSNLAHGCTVLTQWFVFVFPILFALCLNAYYVLIIAWITKAAYNLQKVSYCRYRIPNIVVRLQMRTMVLAVVTQLMSNTLLWVVQFGSCNSYAITWLGMLPLQVCTVGLLVSQTYLCMPHVQQQQDKPLATLRQFSWQGGNKDILKSVRGHPEEPMFCFETALKAMYWSYLVYNTGGETNDQRFNVETAMRLWQCDESEVIWDREIDTKLIMGWGPSIVVLAFCGTQSTRNLLTDLRFNLKPHPLAAGGERVRYQNPKVHAGFLTGWTHNSFNKKVLDKLSMLLSRHRSSSPPLPPFQIITTGHSLGGALATLAAYEIAVHFQQVPAAPGGVAEGGHDPDKVDSPLQGMPSSAMSIQCYTFGAPRAGNHAFAAECNARVPDLWNIIHDRDVIVHRGKVVVYKRPGQRVTINTSGDMVVRPSFLESNTLHAQCLDSVDHHLLSSYLKAMASIVASQFEAGKGFPDGALALLDMCRKSEVMQALMANAFGIQYRDMKSAMLALSQGKSKGPLSKFVKKPATNWSALIFAFWPLGY